MKALIPFLVKVLKAVLTVAIEVGIERLRRLRSRKSEKTKEKEDQDG